MTELARLQYELDDLLPSELAAICGSLYEILKVPKTKDRHLTEALGLLHIVGSSESHGAACCPRIVEAISDRLEKCGGEPGPSCTMVDVLTKLAHQPRGRVSEPRVGAARSWSGQILVWYQLEPPDPFRAPWQLCRLPWTRISSKTS